MKKNLLFLMLLLSGCAKIGDPSGDLSSSTYINKYPTLSFTYAGWGYQFTRAAYGGDRDCQIADIDSAGISAINIALYTNGLSNSGGARLATITMQVKAKTLLAVGTYPLAWVQLDLDGSQWAVLSSPGTFVVDNVTGNLVSGWITGSLYNPVTGYVGELDNAGFSAIEVR